MVVVSVCLFLRELEIIGLKVDWEIMGGFFIENYFLYFVRY